MRLPISIALGLVAALSSLEAGYAQPTPSEQRTACMADAVKLCFWDIPNRKKIEACMASKHDQLSPGCRVVFDASRSPDRSDVANH